MSCARRRAVTSSRGTWGVWIAPAAESSETNSSAHGSFGSPGSPRTMRFPPRKLDVDPRLHQLAHGGQGDVGSLVGVEPSQTKHTDGFEGSSNPGRG